MPRYTKCPYYIDDSRRTISCEDVARLFDSLKLKNEHMDRYCDKDWQKCRHAAELEKAYDALEKGDRQALEKQKIKSLEHEIRSNLIKIGRAEKKIRLQDEKIKNLIGSNKKLMDARRKEHERRMKAEKDLEYAQGRVADDIMRITQIYEDRIAYLMDTYTDGVLKESDVEEWAKGIEFAVTHEVEADERIWKVVKRSEESSESDKDVQNKVEE